MGQLWRRQWHSTAVLLPGSHGWRSLEGCSPWGRKESDTTERLHFHFSLSCIGEGNGNPLQCSCLENPRDRGAWWAAIYGVAKSRTRLMRLSSSSIMEQLTDCTGNPYQDRSRDALAPGGAWGTRVTLLVGVQGRRGSACSGRGRSWKKDEGLQAQDAGRQEAAHHLHHSA